MVDEYLGQVLLDVEALEVGHQRFRRQVPERLQVNRFRGRHAAVLKDCLRQIPGVAELSAEVAGLFLVQVPDLLAVDHGREKTIAGRRSAWPYWGVTWKSLSPSAATRSLAVSKL